MFITNIKTELRKRKSRHKASYRMIPSRERIERPQARSSPSSQKVSQPSNKDATSGYSLKSNKNGYLVPAKTKVQRPSPSKNPVGNQGIRVTPMGITKPPKSTTTTQKTTSANDGIRITPCGLSTTTSTTRANKTAPPKPDTGYQLKGKNGHLVPSPNKKTTTNSSWSYYNQ